MLATLPQEHRKAWRAFVVETVALSCSLEYTARGLDDGVIWRLPRCLFNIHAFYGNLLLCLCLLSSLPVPPTPSCPVTSVEYTSLQLLSSEGLHQDPSFHQQWADAG